MMADIFREMDSKEKLDFLYQEIQEVLSGWGEESEEDLVRIW